MLKKARKGDYIMSEKEDLRVRKTKKALFDAFIKLLSQKPFDEITVNELCDEAGVRRATFYKHYSDKFDFLTAYVRLLRDRIDRMIWKDEKPLPKAPKGPRELTSAEKEEYNKLVEGSVQMKLEL